jgi:uncharacterized SAM-binding protein YcdF (DUF218 family)
MADILVAGSLLAAAESVATPPASHTTKASAVVVLFGDGERFGSNTRRSLEHALATASENATFVCVGGARPARRYWGGCDMRAWLIDRGVRSDRIAVDFLSFDTASNLRQLDLMLRAHGIPYSVLVTDSLHALRIRTLFAMALPDGVAVLGYSLMDGSLASLVNGFARSQYEVFAWLSTAVLPETLRALAVEWLRDVHSNASGHGHCE